MNREELLATFCQDAVRIKSYSGQEGEIASFMKQKMEEYGFDEVKFLKYGSVLGIIRGKRPGKTILFDGHIDEVDVIDEDQWQYPPFGGEIHDGKIYGRGSSDMKGGLITMISAVAQFAEDCDRDFPGTLCCSCSVHEECFEGVSCREISAEVNPDLVIIGEASTGGFRIGQRGRAEVVVETHGKSCHSASPEKGINAAIHMAALIQNIEKIEPRENPNLGKGIFVLTDVISSPYPGASVVPSLCRATYDRRTLPGEDEAEILRQIQEAIDATKKEIPELDAKVYIAEGEADCWTGETIKAKRFFPAWELTEDHPLIHAALTGMRNAGVDPTVSYYSFCTNASHFCGEKGIPCIGYGPSLETLAHVRNEYIEIEELHKAFRGYMGMLQGLCTDTTA